MLAFVARFSDDDKSSAKEKAADKIKCHVRTVNHALRRPGKDTRRQWEELVQRDPWMMGLANLADFAELTGLSVDHLLFGKGVAKPAAAIVQQRIEHLLSDDPTWRAFVRRWSTGVDGDKALRFVVEHVRELVTELSETDAALQHAETLGNLTLSNPHGFHAFRRLYTHVGQSSPASQQKAAALLTDWSPSVVGIAVNGDTVWIDRFGAKRRTRGA